MNTRMKRTLNLLSSIHDNRNSSVQTTGFMLWLVILITGLCVCTSSCGLVRLGSQSERPTLLVEVNRSQRAYLKAIKSDPNYLEYREIVSYAKYRQAALMDSMKRIHPEADLAHRDTVVFLYGFAPSSGLEVTVISVDDVINYFSRVLTDPMHVQSARLEIYTSLSKLATSDRGTARALRYALYGDKAYPQRGFVLDGLVFVASRVTQDGHGGHRIGTMAFEEF